MKLEHVVEAAGRVVLERFVNYSFSGFAVKLVQADNEAVTLRATRVTFCANVNVRMWSL